MARKQSLKSTGKLVVLDHESRILADNPFNDPTLRKLAVWLPPGYDDGTARAGIRPFRVAQEAQNHSRFQFVFRIRGRQPTGTRR